MSEQIPSVGRIVQYTNLGSVDSDGNMIYPPTQQAALITAVDEDGVSLLVFYKGGGMFPMTNVPFSEAYERGHWSLPKRVP